MSFKPTKSDCLKVRETMFDFIKRKKHQQLQQSLKQFDLESNSHEKKNIHLSASGKKSFYDEIIEQPSSIPLFSNRKSSLGRAITVTPKKITFGDENDEEVNYRSARRPLVEMISANKNKGRQNYNSVTQRQKSQNKSKINKQSFVQPNNMSSSTLEPFIKRKIQVSLENISQKIGQILRAGQSAEQKNDQLSVALVKFVKQMSKDSSGGVDKKLGDIRYILSSMDSSLSKFSSPSYKNILQQIDEFGDSLKTHLHELQSNISTNLREHYEQKILLIKNQKQEQKSLSQKQIHKLQREIQRLNKLIDKQDKQNDNLINELQEKVNVFMDKNDNLRIQIAEKQQSFSQKIQNITNQLTKQRQNASKFQKQLKSVTYQHQQSLLNSQKNRQQQLSVRQAYLFDQIQAMKIAFNTDISELHKLYESKQISSEQKINQITKQIDDLRNKSKCDRQVSDKILAEVNISRKDNSMLKIKNQDLVHDLCKINDELFRHWIALKDVKTLAQRLNVFKYFDRIYLDLGYDPLLFRS